MISVIITVYNEAASIDNLLASIAAQTRQPDEIVIVDGGSTDGTPERILGWQDRLPIRLLCQPGCNISQGRNRAIAAACGDIIASTDAGVRLSSNWLRDLTDPLLADPSLHAVSGFFVADPQTAFELAMGATVLPLVNEIDPQKFLPSSRSVAFRRAAWEAAGGYPEWLDYCEDLLFDFALRKQGTLGWAPEAVAHFRPRSNLRSFWTQYYRYARGDGKADLFRKRHAIRYATYTAAPIAFIAGFWYKVLWAIVALAGLVYLAQPYRRLLRLRHAHSTRDTLEAAAWIPIIRLTGDLAKMTGYPAGIRWRLKRKKRLS